MYGKEESKTKRKLGHINIVALDKSTTISDLLDTVEQLKKKLTVQPMS
jgi:phosphoribosylaminoimidazole carboxylase (NCAIR synthetase)